MENKSTDELKEELQNADFIQLDFNTLESITKMRTGFLIALIIAMSIIPWLPVFNDYLYYAVLIVLAGIIWLTIKINQALAARALLESFNYLELTYINEDGKTKHKVICDDDQLERAYLECGNPNEKSTLSKYKKALTDLLFYKNIVKGYANNSKVDKELWYLMVDNQFYWDDEHESLLAFSSKESAQSYIDRYIKNFKGYITPLRVTVDGQIDDKGDK